VEDLDGEVLACLAQDLLLLLLQDLAGAMVRIDDLVPDLVDDMYYLGELDLQIGLGLD
jgi:hypothetical protein